MPTLERQERESERKLLLLEHAINYNDMILSNDKDILKQKAFALLLSNADIPVLITGETGTGKELFARIIHGERKGEFVAVNCAGIPDTLLEAEFFGCVRGAYTGAYDRAGYIEQAENGSLFLDEIGDMPKMLQCKLLRYLENNEYRRIGDSKVRYGNARIIAATNIEGLINSKNFRKDLYHRLAVAKITIKPLWKRDESDLELLVGKYASIRMPSNEREEILTEIKELIRTNDTEFKSGNVRSLVNLLKVRNLKYGK